MRAPWSLALIPSLLLSCGDAEDGNDPPADAAYFDAALGADSGEILPDAAATSVCGSGDSVEQCILAEQVCLETDFSGTLVTECKPVPTGCETQRDCAHCQALCQGLTCEESLTENAITCISP